MPTIISKHIIGKWLLFLSGLILGISFNIKIRYEWILAIISLFLLIAGNWIFLDDI